MVTRFCLSAHPVQSRKVQRLRYKLGSKSLSVTAGTGAVPNAEVRDLLQNDAVPIEYRNTIVVPHWAGLDFGGANGMAMTDTMAAQGVTTLMLTPEEAARELRISRAKVYQMMASGELPSIKLGGNRRIRLSALRAYIDRLEVEANGAA